MASPVTVSHRREHARRRRVRVAAAFVAALPLGILTACGGSGTPLDTSSAPADTAVRIAGVPDISLGLLQIGEDHGYFAQQHLKLDIKQLDSGPNVVTGLVAGQYDIGGTAYAPPLIALASGQQLRLVAPIGANGDPGANAVLVRNDSSIKSWKDLVGKKVATNAPRSMLVLWTQKAIDMDGGDPAKLSVLPLPFNQIAGKVSSGEIDAGILLQPFVAQGLSQHPNLKNLGDPSTSAPIGTPAVGMFTTAKIAASKAGVLLRFKIALANSVAYANAHLSEARADGARMTGLSASTAELVPMGKFETTVDASSFGPLVDALEKYKWVSQKVDINAFLGTTS
jgi:NitT/TauT family transport system substrate-binding protein